jgi:hypothetical protein
MHSPVDGSGTLKLTWKVGKYPLKIVIFHSYVSLPEGMSKFGLESVWRLVFCPKPAVAKKEQCDF